MSKEQPITPMEAAVEAEYIPEIVPDIENSGRPIVVYTADSEEDGEIVRGLLESEGIQVILTTAGSPVYGEAFSLGEGQAGEILVAPADVERAKSILAATSDFEQIDEESKGE